MALGTGQIAPVLAQIDSDTMDRDASEDLQTVIGGKVPPERDDISPEYINYLNEYLLTDKFMLLQQKSPKKAAAVSDFIDSIIAKGQRKANKLALQPNPLAPGQPPSTPPAPAAPGQPPIPGQPQPAAPQGGGNMQPQGFPQLPPGASPPTGFAGSLPSAMGAAPPLQ